MTAIRAILHETGHGNWLVRSFSDDLSNKSPNDPLSRGLTTKVVLDRDHEKRSADLRDQWNMFLLEGQEMAVQSIPNEEMFLLEQSRKLYAAWAKFCDRLDENQSQSVSKDVPSLKQLHEAVTKASDSWQEDRKSTRTGRLKEKFSSICSSLEQHSTLLSMIPSNDKYICLLTGSLSAIAKVREMPTNFLMNAFFCCNILTGTKASTNHADIADGVAESLQMLSEDMVIWNSVIQEYGHSNQILRCIMQLYVVVFEFLTEIFSQWSRGPWKRLVTSLNQGSFRKLFDEKHDRMVAIERKMERLANLEFQKNTRQAVGDMQVKIEALMKNRENADHEYKNMLVGLGTNVQLLLSQSIRFPSPQESCHTELLLPSVEANPRGSALLDSDAKPAMSSTGSETSDKHQLASSPLQPEMNDGYRFQREGVLHCLKPIVEAYGRDIQTVMNASLKASKLSINAAVGHRISDWTSSNRSEALWIQGPRGTNTPSQNTLTAACLVALSNQNNIACLSYFCGLSFENVSSPTEISPKNILSNLLNSLITQIVLILPDCLFTSFDLTKARFEQILEDEDFDFDYALHLLHDLISLAPRHLHCIIEGAQLLEDRDDSSYNRLLQRVLDELVSFPGTEVGTYDGTQFKPVDGKPSLDSHLIKVCFTTDGYVDGLAQLVEVDMLGKIVCGDELNQSSSSEGGRRLMPHRYDEME